MAWGLSLSAAALALVDIGMQLALNRWNKTFYDAFERRSWSELQQAALLFLVLLAAATTTVVMTATMADVDIALRAAFEEVFGATTTAAAETE